MFTVCETEFHLIQVTGRQHRRCIIPQAVTQSSAPEDGRNYLPKHVGLNGIINKPLFLRLVGCLYYCQRVFTPVLYLKVPICSMHFTLSITRTEYHTGRTVFAGIYPTFRFRVGCKFAALPHCL